MEHTCRSNKRTGLHRWLELDAVAVCLYCEAEVPIRPIVTVELRGGYL